MTDLPERRDERRLARPILLAGRRAAAQMERTPVGGMLERFGLAGPPQGHPATRKQRRKLIAQAFEAEILPRLKLGHEAAPPPRPLPGGNAAIALPDLAALAKLVLRQDLAGSYAFLEAVRARGVSPARISLDLLAPTARRLGEMWDDDLCNFTEVTLGLGVLRKLLGAVYGPLEAKAPIRDAARRVLLASLATNQHSFGLGMVADFFDRSGWDVATEAAATADNLALRAGQEWFAVAGLTLSTDEGIGPMALAIRAIRQASRNPIIGIMVGGPVFTARPELALLVGADLTAPDAEQAVLRAEGLRVLMSILPNRDQSIIHEVGLPDG